MKETPESVIEESSALLSSHNEAVREEDRSFELNFDFPKPQVCYLDQSQRHRIQHNIRPLSHI